MERQITDDLSSLFAVLPPEIAEIIRELNRNDELLEIILDLGRVPTARFIDGEYVLLDREITQEEIDLVEMQIGDFDADNRAGLERTLHRISAIRNRRGEIVGLTCRVGRAVYGTIDIIKDILDSGKGILFLGKPGVGKTTMLREAARVLAEARRVVIVDTSNEIGGDGDVAHPAIGKSRRMQVPTPSLQHEVMIEAVENHAPEVIIIDEIGRELEAQAARTIAERGVQLIGTAHGITLDNLLLNPTLSDLVGGIESVTLSDEEARRRGTQKTVLERRAPPTFAVLIELQDRDTLIIHPDVATSVDLALRGYAITPEIRRRGPDGQAIIEQRAVQPREAPGNNRNRSENNGRKKGKKKKKANGNPINVEDYQHYEQAVEESGSRVKGRPNLRRLSVYPYAIARNRLIEAADQFAVPLNVVDSLDEADALLTIKNFYRRRPRLIVDAEQRGIPIYVLRSNTVTQIEDFVIDTFQLELDENDPLARAIREVDEAISAVRNGAESIDLKPQRSSIRRKQHDMIRRAHLHSHSYGKEPYRHVRVYRSN